MRLAVLGALALVACGLDLADTESPPVDASASGGKDAAVDGGLWPDSGSGGSAGAPDAALDVDVDSGGFSYSWKTDPSWSSCSKSCGGGVKTRDVWCERSDGVKVADSYCGGQKPSTSTSCNTQPCCSTADLKLGFACGGTAQVQWFPFSPNDSSSAALTKCRDMCTSWATTNGYKQWCCLYYDDSSPGANWVCRVYDGYSTSPSSANQNHASLGQCN